MGNCNSALGHNGFHLPCSPEAAATLAAQWHLQDEGYPEDMYVQDARDVSDPSSGPSQDPMDRIKYSDRADMTTPLTARSLQQEKEPPSATRAFASSCTMVVMVLSFVLFAALSVIVIIMPAVAPQIVTTTTTTTTSTTTTTTSSTTSTTIPRTHTVSVTTTTRTRTITTATTTTSATTTTATTSTATSTTAAITTSHPDTTTTNRSSEVGASVHSTSLTPTKNERHATPAAKDAAASASEPAKKQTTGTTTSPPKPPPPAHKDLHLGLTVQHLDYTRLMAAPKLLDVFKRTLQGAIAYQVGGGVNPSEVLLELQAGSIKVGAVLPALPSAVADRASSSLQSESASFGRKLAISISDVQGIGAASTGPIAVKDVTAHSAEQAKGGFTPQVLAKWVAACAVVLFALILVFGIKSWCCSGKTSEPNSGTAAALVLEGGDDDASPATPEKRVRPQQVSPARPLGGGGPPSGSQASPSDPRPQRAKAKAKASVGARLPRNAGPGSRLPMVAHSAPQSRSSSRSSRRPGQVPGLGSLGSTDEEPVEAAPNMFGMVPGASAPGMGPTSAPAPEVASQEMSISDVELSSPRGSSEGDEEAEFLKLAAEMGISEPRARQAWREHPGDSDSALAAALC